jgi:hypothetical protein
VTLSKISADTCPAVAAHSSSNEDACSNGKAGVSSA